jgi:hypothetical protein
MANKREDIIYPGQYDNENVSLPHGLSSWLLLTEPQNWKAHEQWTGPQILEQLPEINLFCTTVGTGGCITGTSSYLKSHKPSIKTLGVFNVFGDPTPGPRHFENFNSCGFPWAKTVDTFVDVASVDSYRMSMQLSREGIIAGPSSGQALKGILDYVGRLKDNGELVQLADPATGEISCVFTCSDLPYQYLPMYFQKLKPEEFPSIQNEVSPTPFPLPPPQTRNVNTTQGPPPMRPTQARRALDPHPFPSPTTARPPINLHLIQQQRNSQRLRDHPGTTSPCGLGRKGDLCRTTPRHPIIRLSVLLGQPLQVVRFDEDLFPRAPVLRSSPPKPSINSIGPRPPQQGRVQDPAYSRVCECAS